MGGSSCSAWTPGLAPAMAGRGQAGDPPSPDGDRRRRGSLLSARGDPAASASACPPVCPEQTREAAGPGRGGVGAGPQRHRPLPPQRPSRPASAPPGGRGGDCSQSRDWGRDTLEPVPLARGSSAGQTWGEERALCDRGLLWVHLEGLGIEGVAEDRLGSAR